MILEEHDLHEDVEWNVELAELDVSETELDRCSSSELGLVMGDFADCDNWSLEDFSDLLNGVA